MKLFDSLVYRNFVLVNAKTDSCAELFPAEFLHDVVRKACNGSFGGYLYSFGVENTKPFLEGASEAVTSGLLKTVTVSNSHSVID